MQCCMANENEARRYADERKLPRREMGNIFCRVPAAVRSGYIIQAIRDGNVDIVTSIRAGKRNARGTPGMGKKKRRRGRSRKGREGKQKRRDRDREGAKRRGKRVANVAGRVRHGSLTRFSSLPRSLFFSLTLHPTRVLDNRSLVLSVRPSVHPFVRSFVRRFSLFGQSARTIRPTGRFRKTVKD